jgi:hypothetical protein
MSAVVFGTEEKYKELQTASYAPDFYLSSLWTARGHGYMNYPYRGKAAAIVLCAATAMQKRHTYPSE